MEYTSATMNSERGDTFDIVRRRALEVIQDPTYAGYSYLDLSASFGLPAHSIHTANPKPHSLHVLHSVVALPPKPHYLQFAQKDIPFPLEQHHLISTPLLENDEKDHYLDLYHEVLVYLSASTMEKIGNMTKSDHDRYVERLAEMGSEDPLAIYALMASDYEEPGVLSPDSVRIYVPHGYSLALVMRDLATKSKVGVSLN